ncbi:MAG TPA: hypothetical protein VGO91_07700 [Pyrinomonadaceae bacterium]|nr:hypothetical protein [Pyrinomonadaceae bacterium]
MKLMVRQIAVCLCISLALPLWALPARAQCGSAGPQPARQSQKRAIIVNAEQPNVWTLEQAHYLLAQMHRRNLDLKAKGLDDLDPNEINGLNFDVMRTLVEFGVAFDDAARFNNSLLKRDKSFDAGRAIRLQTRRDQLADESLVLNRDIARLGRERALAKTQEGKDTLGAQITELTAVRDANDKEATRMDSDLKTAGGPTGDVQATDAQVNSDPNKLPKSTFDDAFKDVTKKLIDRFNEAPKLNATLRLDNFLQMQYEIIAKQLTLLRDEVGPGERIIFLELPQTVNATYDKANNKWAQSWWKVAGYTTLKDKEKMKNTRERSIQRIKGGGADGENDDENEEEGGDKKTSAAADIKKTTHSDEGLITMSRVFRDAIDAFGIDGKGGQSDRVEYVPLSTRGNEVMLDNRSIRTIELIPRQSSLNVNDIKLRARSGMLTVVAKTLFGVGARLNVQRQRETFSQFVQQELYSSGFGKGSREFGWTFTPMPGTDRVMSGTRTTYAVMVVPVEAEALVLYSTGCYFPRSEYQPFDFESTGNDRWIKPERQSRNCSERKAFVVPIPGGGDERNYDFWVDGLEYVPAQKGDRVVLSIYGRNFPAQIGLMVDGIPLTQSIGVAQPLIRDDSTAYADARAELKDAKVSGSIERIDANQIVAVFERPNGKDGTQPVITLTAPGKAKILNRLKLYINSTTKRTTLDDKDGQLMFGQRAAERDKFRIDKLEVFRSRMPGYLTALASGAGFSTGQQALVNGSYPVTTYVDSATLLRAEFPVPSDETIRITLVNHDDNNTPKNEEATITSDSVINPALLRISSVEVVSYEAATEEEPATLVVKIEGTGFTDELRSSLGELAVKSATEAILKITDPEAAAVVILTDRQTGQQVRTIVTRKSKPAP